jgi:integrase
LTFLTMPRLSEVRSVPLLSRLARAGLVTQRQTFVLGSHAAGGAGRNLAFHGLPHTHASQLIAGNVDIVTISKRLGHAKPSVTLAIYAHMFHTDDSKAAVAINAALG